MSAPVPVTIFPTVPADGPPRRHAARSIGRAIATPVVALAVALAGTGWLYALRHAGALGLGPTLPMALPLQRLAGGAGQPVVRLVVAWLPSGLLGGLLLVAMGFRRRIPRAAILFSLTLIMLLAAGAASDAVTASEALAAHWRAQPQRLAVWLAAACVAMGAALPRGTRR